jgi:hypothetical protein
VVQCVLSAEFALWGAGDLPWGLAARREYTKKPMPAHDGVLAGQRWCVMNAADRVIHGWL